MILLWRSAFLVSLCAWFFSRPLVAAEVIDAASLRGKVLCGYQGWFRCPGDAANLGWVHWSRDGKRIAPETLSFEMWPDVSDLPESSRHVAPGFTDAAGKAMELFSSDDVAVVRRHFEWMREHRIDGVWLQHFVIELPGAPAQKRYETRRRVLDHVRRAARETGRVWALTYDLSGTPPDRIFEAVTNDWKKLVEEGITRDDRYIHEGGKPVVEIFGFYAKGPNAIGVDLGNQLIDFFKAPGPYAAFVVGGGDWQWRRNSDPEWAKMLRRLDGYSPWNIGNTSRGKDGVVHGATGYWAEDKAECERNGMLWLPVIYPGFSWDNLKKQPPGSTIIPRRGGAFLWEQFAALSKLGVDSAMVAMFDEADEGTAVFKVTNALPLQAHFLGYEGLPSDWYLRLVGAGAGLLREKQTVPVDIPIKP
jgi:hypothetical protein